MVNGIFLSPDARDSSRINGRQEKPLAVNGTMITTIASRGAAIRLSHKIRDFA
jgi:hypothetical protein